MTKTTSIARARRHPLDGQMLTMHEMRERMPALSESSIRRRIRRGMTTQSQMLALDPAEGRRKGGQATSARKRGWGFA